VKVVRGGLTFQLKVAGDAAKAGYAGNAIVEAFTEYEVKGKGGKGPKRKRRASVGVLPAVPFVVVQP